MSRGIWYLYFTLFLAACGQRKDPAPVSFGHEESTSSEDFDAPVQSQNSGSMISYIDPEQEIKPELQAEKIIIIKPQENLAVIAERYQIDRDDIIVRNNLMAPYYLFPGQKLKLPESARLQPTSLKKTPSKKSQPVESLDVLNDVESNQDPVVSQKKPALKKEARRSVEDREKELEDKFSKLEADLKKSKLSKKANQKDEQSDDDDTVKTPVKKPDSLGTKNKDKPLEKEEEKSSKEVIAEDTLEPETKISTDKKVDLEKPKVKTAEPVEATSFKLGSPLTGNIRDKIVSDFNQTAGKIKNDGINIKANTNAPILAAQGGQVVYAGNEMQGFGNLILLKHEGGWMTAYGHCAEILVKEKQVVKQGETIAKVGNTGSVRDAQLHFQLRKKSTVVDPKLYLE